VTTGAGTPVSFAGITPTSPDEYRAAVARIEQWYGQLLDAIDAVRRGTAQADAFDWAGQLGLAYHYLWQVVRWLLQVAGDILEAIARSLEALIQDLRIPLLAYEDVRRWKVIRSRASEVAGRLEKDALDPDPAYPRWTGFAAKAYRDQVEPQRNAARRIAAIAETASGSLNIFAAAAMTYIATVGLLLFRVLTTAIQVGIFLLTRNIMTLKDIIRDLITLGGLLIATLATDAALSAVIHSQGQNLELLAGETANFPGGRWPDPTGGTVAWPRRVSRRDGSHAIEVRTPVPPPARPRYP